MASLLIWPSSIWGPNTFESHVTMCLRLADGRMNGGRPSRRQQRRWCLLSAGVCEFHREENWLDFISLKIAIGTIHINTIFHAMDILFSTLTHTRHMCRSVVIFVSIFICPLLTFLCIFINSFVSARCGLCHSFRFSFAYRIISFPCGRFFHFSTFARHNGSERLQLPSHTLMQCAIEFRASVRFTIIAYVQLNCIEIHYIFNELA